MGELVEIGRGVRLDCALSGPRTADSPPLLLLRPLGGSMSLWGDFAAALAGTLRVIAFDPRGVGRSSPAPVALTTRAMARDAAGLLDALGVTRAHVFGESLGGMVGSWLARDAPARVARLVLASTVPGPGALSARGLVRLLSIARCLARPGPGAELCMVRRLVGAALPPHLEAAIRATPARRRDLAALALAAARHHAPRLDRRALLLFGARDPIASRASRVELARDCPAGLVELVDGAGHALTLERPLEIAARVETFLRAPPP